MTSGPTSSLGGLYVTVNLDVTDAMRQLDALQAKFRNTLRSATVQVGGTGGFNGLAQGANNATKSINGVSNSIKGLQTSVVRLNGYTKVSTAAFREFGREAQRLGQYSKISSRPIITPQQTANLSAFRQELVNTAAVLAPGRAGSLVYGANALGRSFQALGVSGLSAGAIAGITGVGIAAIAAAAAITTLVLGISKITTVGIDAARTLETLTVSMTALLGGPAAARGEIGWLVELSKISPFLTDTIIAMDKFLISQGVASGRLRGDLIKSVTDLGSALGLTDDQLGSITYALAQVQARGYLSGDELRQLANQFIPVWEALGTTAELAGKSRQELRKMAEEGQISSTQFFEALIGYSQRFEGAAEAQSRTLDGLLAKLQDIARFNIGQAFLDVEGVAIGPIEVLRDLLTSLVATLERIDFAPLAASIGNFLDALIGPFTRFFEGEGAGIENFFESTLPRVINVAAEYVRGFMSTLGALWNVAKQVFTALKEAAVIVGGAFVVGLGVAVTAIHTFASMCVLAIQPVRLLIAAIVALFRLISGDFAGAAAAWNTGIDSIRTGAQSLLGVIAAPIKGVNAALGVLNAISSIKLPDGAELTDTANGLQDVGSAVNSLGGGDGGGGGAGGARKTVDELARLMDDLYDLTRRWFGLRSELEKGLLGPEGFTASVEQIASMGKRLIETLRGIGASGVASLVERNTNQLIALARKREQVADRLKDAEDALAEALAARERFGEQIRRNAIDFANALQTETETQRSFALVSERGFFIERETTKQKSFVDSLKQRAQALRDFLANIKALKGQGLDPDLLKQLMEAGPEAAGGVAEELAKGGDAMIAEVNALQGDIKKSADSLSKFGTKTFHDAGVNQAKSLVKGLTDELKSIDNAAKKMSDQVFNAVLPWARQAEEAGAAAAAGAARGIASGIGGVAGAMGGIGGAIGAGTSGWADLFGAGTEGAGGILGEGTGGWLETVLEWTEDALGLIEGWGEDVEGFFDGLKITGPDFERFFNNIRTGLENALTWIKRTATGIGTWIGNIWNTIVTFVTNLPAELARAGAALWEWIQGAIPKAIDNMTEFVGEVIGFVLMLPVNIAAGLAKAGVELYEWIKDSIPKVGQWLGKVWDAISRWITQTLPRLISRGAEMLSAFLRWVGDAVRQIPAKLASFATAVYTWASTFIKNLPAKFISLISGWARFGSALIGAIVRGLQSAVNAVMDWGRSLINAIIDGIIKWAPSFLKGPISDFFKGKRPPAYKLPATTSYQSLSAMNTTLSAASYNPNVNVYIGDQQLRGIVQSEVTKSGSGTANRIMRGSTV